jgi:hypothetical protein
MVTSIQSAQYDAHLCGLSGILHQATDAKRSALYEAIGVSAVYNPEQNQVRLGADPVASTACRRWDLRLEATLPLTRFVSLSP